MLMKNALCNVRRPLMLSLLAWVTMGLLLLCTPARAWAKGEPLSDDPYADAVQVAWEDGTYLVDVSMEGGSGRASVATPAEVSIVGGKAAASIAWSSPNYDYMVVAGKTYLPVNDEGNSVFLIPLLELDEPFDVIGDTTAMSQPHEVAYQLTFYAASAMAADVEETSGSAFPLPVVAACVAAAGACLAIVASRRKKTA